MIVAPFNTIITAPFGWVGLRFTDDGRLQQIQYLEKILPHRGEEHPIVAQLQAYFANPRATLPALISSEGSAFQQRVWQQISAIPCGETRTYGAVAKNIASAPRAVGGACGKNPLVIVVPCHRVVASNGIGGFAGHKDERSVTRNQALGGSGFYLEIKRWLLKHEGVL